MHARCLGAEQITHARVKFLYKVYLEGIHYGLCQKHTCAVSGNTEIIVYGEDSTARRAKGVKSEFTLQ
jgi:hypothetical protein